ncbi:MAG: ABC transporter ATP-binding protein [Alistipes sp.]
MSISLRHITLGYGRRTLLDDISADIPAGALTALLGRNGTGKSTLLRAVAGLSDVVRGSIVICGQELAVLSNLQRASIVSFVTTDKVRIAHLTCEDVVSLGRAPYTNWIGHLQQGDRVRVARALEQVGMSSFAKKTMDQMSDGECQRILIARALAQDTPVILLDEPTAFLDLPNRYELCTLLRRLAHEEHKCIFFSTHDLDIALSLCDSIALIDPPHLHHLPTDRMIGSGHIERLFASESILFDPATQTVRLKK